MGHIVTAVVGTLLGFLAGLLSFRIKARWCTCGLVKTCPECSGRNRVQVEHRAGTVAGLAASTQRPVTGQSR